MDISIGDVKIPLPPLGSSVFLPSAGLAIISGIMMITRKNAVHSALWLIMAFFNLAVMYVMLGAEFLAALQVLVYTGAILVLFLFVIMLLGLREGPKLRGIHTAQLVAAWPVGLILLCNYSCHPFQLTAPQRASRRYHRQPAGVWNNSFVLAQGGNVQVLGQTLYTQFLLPFEVASLVLLLAVVGAIVLSRKEEPAEVEEIVPSLGISLGRRSCLGPRRKTRSRRSSCPRLA